MAGSTTKKAIVRRFEKEALTGYINPVSYLQPSGIEMLTTVGNIVSVPYDEIRAVSFVRDFQDLDPERDVFQTRPKMEGLWIGFRFRDGGVMEGVMPNNLLQLEHYGFTIVPPDPYGNQQRVFIPKTALTSVEILGVVGSPLRRRKAKPAAREQIGLFEE